MIKQKPIILFSRMLFITIQACRGESSKRSGSESANEEGALTNFQIEYGIGPVTEALDISDELDSELIDQGRKYLITPKPIKNQPNQ